MHGLEMSLTQGHPCWKHVGSDLIVHERIHHPLEVQQSQRHSRHRGKVLYSQPQPENASSHLSDYIFVAIAKTTVMGHLYSWKAFKGDGICLLEEGIFACLIAEQCTEESSKIPPCGLFLIADVLICENVPWFCFWLPINYSEASCLMTSWLVVSSVS